MPEPREEPPHPPEHLKLVGGEAGWVRSLVPTGALLLAGVLALNFLAPTALWFLLYPLLILGGLLALLTAISLLLRHL